MEVNNKFLFEINDELQQFHCKFRFRTNYFGKTHSL